MTGTPHQPQRVRSGLWWLLVGVVMLLAASLADHDLERLLTSPEASELPRRNWWQALRAVGWLPTWVFVCALWILSDRRDALRRGAWLHRGLMVLTSAAASGAAAEVFKAAFRRQRPHGLNFYAFDWGGMGIDGLGIGTVSSHAAVAFGGAFMAAWFVPAWRWPLLAAAAGCAFTRVRAGDHYVSDCVAAAVVAWIVAGALARWARPAATSSRERLG